MNFKTFSNIFGFIPPELLHELFIIFLKMEIFKQEGKVFDLRLALADFSTKYIFPKEPSFKNFKAVL